MKSVSAVVFATTASLSAMLYSQSCSAQPPVASYQPAIPGYRTGGGPMPPDPIEEEKWKQATYDHDEGIVQQKKKNYAAAIAAFQKSLPRRIDSYQQLGDIYTVTGQNDKAMEAYRKLIYSYGQGSRSDIRIKYALLLHRAGRYGEALSEYQQGVEKLHDDYLGANVTMEVNQQNVMTKQLVAGAHLALAIYYLKSSDDESLRHCAEALRLKPGYGGSYLCLAHCSRLASSPLAMQFGPRRVQVALHKAIELGTGPVRKAAEKDLEVWFAENDRQLKPGDTLTIPSAKALDIDFKPDPIVHAPGYSNGVVTVPGNVK